MTIIIVSQCSEIKGIVFKEEGSILGWLTYVNIKSSKPRKYEKVLYILVKPQWEDESKIISCTILSSKNTFAI